MVTTFLRASLEEFVRQYAPVCYKRGFQILGHRHDAEDASQETLLKAWRNWNNFRGEYPASLSAWFGRININEALNAKAKRDRHRHKVKQGDFVHHLPDERPSFEKKAERLAEIEELRAAVFGAIHAAVQILRPQHRDALESRINQEESCMHKPVRRKCDKCRNMASYAMNNVIEECKSHLGLPSELTEAMKANLIAAVKAYFLKASWLIP